MPTPMRPLEHPRFTLEPLEAAHAAAMFELLSDPAIYEFENAPPESLQSLTHRYTRLQARGPADGSELWLNWVLRLKSSEVAGYVQATVQPDGLAFVAYELASRHWRQGLGSAAVQLMMNELQARHGVLRFCAVFKARNHRSQGLLQHLGFVPASADEAARLRDEADEGVMVRLAPGPRSGVAAAP